MQEPLEDSIRRFVEECENLQAFQLFMDAHDGFAGFGTSIVDYIAEEYSAKSVLIYPIFPSQLSPEAHVKYLSSASLCFADNLWIDLGLCQLADLEQLKSNTTHLLMFYLG